MVLHWRKNVDLEDCQIKNVAILSFETDMWKASAVSHMVDSVLVLKCFAWRQTAEVVSLSVRAQRR